MDFYNIPIGFGLALSANTAAMNRYTHLSETQKQDILNKTHNVRSEKEMYALVASIANGTFNKKRKSAILTDLRLLIHFGIVCPTQKIVNGNIVEICDFGKGRGGNVNISSFIIAVDPLATGQNLSHFCLRQIFVLP